MAFIGQPEDTRATTSGRRRRWTFPPPVAPLAGQDGLPILEEIQGAAGLTLWQLYRDVTLWQQSRADDPTILFSASLADYPWSAAVLDSQPFGAIARALDGAIRGRDASKRRIALLCRELAGWADERGNVETEVLFCSLSAHVWPRNPDLAFSAGRAERKAGRYERAAEWFRRAIGLARRTGNVVAYATAYRGWGILERLRSQPEAARSMYVKAWRAAVRGGLRELAAAARHDMVPLTVGSQSYAEGQAHIEGAFRLYGSNFLGLARLAADAACLWAWQGYFSLALPLYELALPHVSGALDRAQVLANIARAAAAAESSSGYDDAMERLRELNLSDQKVPPRVWVDLAEGARSLGRTRAALELLGKAIEFAEQRGESSTVTAAHQVIADLQYRERLDVNRDAPPRLKRFAARFHRKLSTISDSGPAFKPLSR